MRETSGDGHLAFHYNRDERLAQKGGEAPPQPRGLFKRNRSLAIILLDVIIIIIMFLLLQFVFTPGRSWTRVGDYRAELSAFRFEDEVYATVEIVRVQTRDGQLSGPDSLVTIRFPGRDPVLDVLPEQRDGKISASEIFSGDEVADDDAVTVGLEIMGEPVTLVSTPRD